MNGASSTAPLLWPFIVYFAAVIAIVVGMVGISAILGPRHRERTTGTPYESGIVPTGSARIRFDVKFYLMAMFFVVFDLEAVFIFAWAESARVLGWSGYVEIVIFIVFLMLGLFYLWRVNALEWGTAKHREAPPASNRRTKATTDPTAAP